MLPNKTEETSNQSSCQYSTPQSRNWRPSRESESVSHKSQPRFILPNTSRLIATTTATSTEVPIAAKPTVLVPVNNQPTAGSNSCRGSLLILPLTVTTTGLQNQKQPTNAVVAQIPTGTTQFLLIRTNPAPTSLDASKAVTSNTGAVSIIAPAKGERTWRGL